MTRSLLLRSDLHLDFEPPPYKACEYDESIPDMSSIVGLSVVTTTNTRSKALSYSSASEKGQPELHQLDGRPNKHGSMPFDSIMEEEAPMFVPGNYDDEYFPDTFNFVLEDSPEVSNEDNEYEFIFNGGLEDDPFESFENNDDEFVTWFYSIFGHDLDSVLGEVEIDMRLESSSSSSSSNLIHGTSHQKPLLEHGQDILTEYDQGPLVAYNQENWPGNPRIVDYVLSASQWDVPSKQTEEAKDPVIPSSALMDTMFPRQSNVDYWYPTFSFQNYLGLRSNASTRLSENLQHMVNDMTFILIDMIFIWSSTPIPAYHVEDYWRICWLKDDRIKWLIGMILERLTGSMPIRQASYLRVLIDRVSRELVKSSAISNLTNKRDLLKREKLNITYQETRSKLAASRIATTTISSDNLNIPEALHQTDLTRYSVVDTLKYDGSRNIDYKREVLLLTCSSGPTVKDDPGEKLCCQVKITRRQLLMLTGLELDVSIKSYSEREILTECIFENDREENEPVILEDGNHWHREFSVDANK